MSTKNLNEKQSQLTETASAFSHKYGNTSSYGSTKSTTRTAKCTMCKTISPSDKDLPFFESRQNEELDKYYCGCHGWD